MKSQYAATILFISSMLFSKLSVIYFIRNVTPAFNPDRLITAGLEVLTILWAGIGILTAAFQFTASLSKRDWDEGSQSSQAHIIHEVRTWTVTESAGGPTNNGDMAIDMAIDPSKADPGH
ncbi:hypothetical protein APSETT445_002555 [Aspergillus pseudonomiae]